MDYIVTEISKLLTSQSKIVIHSISTQNLINDENTILWNTNPLNIDSETYSEFKEAIKIRGSKVYPRTDILSYPDFCIALLCSSEYSLNHIVITSISDRSFSAAWSGLEKVSTTSSNRVRSWLNTYMFGRTSKGYKNTFNIEPELFLRRCSTVSSNNTIENNDADQDILSSVTFEENIIDLNNVYGNKDSPIILRNNSCTPESELDILRMISDICLLDNI